MLSATARDREVSRRLKESVRLVAEGRTADAIAAFGDAKVWELHRIVGLREQQGTTFAAVQRIGKRLGKVRKNEACSEVVRRAANRGDKEALDLLLSGALDGQILE